MSDTAKTARRPAASDRPRRRRRRSDSDDEEEVGLVESFAPWKTALIVAVVAICFCVLYPKMFHPMLMFALGYGNSGGEAPGRSGGGDVPAHFPPHMRGGRPPPGAAFVR